MFVVKPKILPFSFGDDPVNFEDSASVTCLIVSGDLPVDIDWVFNDYPINSYSGINVVKGGKKASMLTIESVNGRHAGNYTCTAKNSAGSESYSTNLSVNGLNFSIIINLFVDPIFHLSCGDNFIKFVFQYFENIKNISWLRRREP